MLRFAFAEFDLDMEAHKRLMSELLVPARELWEPNWPRSGVLHLKNIRFTVETRKLRTLNTKSGCAVAHTQKFDGALFVVSGVFLGKTPQDPPVAFLFIVGHHAFLPFADVRIHRGREVARFQCPQHIQVDFAWF